MLGFFQWYELEWNGGHKWIFSLVSGRVLPKCTLEIIVYFFFLHIFMCTRLCLLTFIKEPDIIWCACSTFVLMIQPGAIHVPPLQLLVTCYCPCRNWMWPFTSRTRAALNHSSPSQRYSYRDWHYHDCWSYRIHYYSINPSLSGSLWEPKKKQFVPIT